MTIHNMSTLLFQFVFVLSTPLRHGAGHNNEKSYRMSMKDMNGGFCEQS